MMIIIIQHQNVVEEVLVVDAEKVADPKKRAEPKEYLKTRVRVNTCSTNSKGPSKQYTEKEPKNRNAAVVTGTIVNSHKQS